MLLACIGQFAFGGLHAGVQPIKGKPCKLQVANIRTSCRPEAKCTGGLLYVTLVIKGKGKKACAYVDTVASNGATMLRSA